MDVTAKFVDETGEYEAQRILMQRNAVAGFMEWAPFLSSPFASIEIKFRLIDDSDNPGGGTSLAFVQVVRSGDLDIYDTGAGFELRTGQDPNGGKADIEVYFDIGNLEQNYWINPLDGSEAPSDKMDLVKVLAHEIGHALGFIGYRDWDDYQLSGTVASQFDFLVEVVNGQPYFAGPHAQQRFGGLIPLTSGNLFHLGNLTGPGTGLVDDLMNGVMLDPAEEYSVSLLDIAILSDLGVPTVLDDTLFGSEADDRTDGGGGNDLIFSFEGYDNLYGGAGDDSLVGGDHIDYLEGGAGDDLVNGGDGTDHAGYLGATNAVTVSLLAGAGQDTGGSGWDILLEIENLQGSDFDDVLEGDDLRNILVGQPGDDTLSGGARNDTLYGTSGLDWLVGGSGRDLINGGADRDVLVGQGGQDTFEYYATDEGGDWITDLSSGDWISLHYIDADVTQADDQEFELVDSFSHSAGEATLTYQDAKGRTVLRLDVDGDAVADMAIYMVGDHRGFGNFVL